MLRHVVLLKFVPEATAEQRQAVVDGLATLPAQIPELRSYVFGADVGISDGNFDLAVVADCDDADGYRAYATHPAHVAVIAERIRPILAERAAVQYQLPA
ncbi:MAG: Dabb family protein [Ilumatobacteraceae bacterium]